MNLLKRLVREEKGQTYVEYGLLIALIGVMLIGATQLLQTGIEGTFNSASGAL